MNANQQFIEEVVKDSRSFHMSNFDKVISLVEVRRKLSVSDEVYDKY